MPVISTLLGGHIPEGVPRTFDALKKAGIPIFAYGKFTTISINFIFQMVKVVNKVRRMDTPPPPPTPEDVLLLREIHDSLKK